MATIARITEDWVFEPIMPSLAELREEWVDQLSMPTPNEIMERRITEQVLPSICEIVESAVHLRTMTALLRAAGLIELISGPGPFTLFAPSEAAFDKIPRWAILELLRPECKSELRETLKHHLVWGKLSVENLEQACQVRTLHGNEIQIDSKYGLRLNGARVLMPNIECGNGLIHIIDTVIPPQ